MSEENELGMEWIGQELSELGLDVVDRACRLGVCDDFAPQTARGTMKRPENGYRRALETWDEDEIVPRKIEEGLGGGWMLGSLDVAPGGWLYADFCRVFRV